MANCVSSALFLNPNLLINRARYDSIVLTLKKSWFAIAWFVCPRATNNKTCRSRSLRSANEFRAVSLCVAVPETVPDALPWAVPGEFPDAVPDATPDAVDDADTAALLALADADEDADEKDVDDGRDLATAPGGADPDAALLRPPLDETVETWESPLDEAVADMLC